MYLLYFRIRLRSHDRWNHGRDMGSKGHFLGNGHRVFHPHVDFSADPKGIVIVMFIDFEHAVTGVFS